MFFQIKTRILGWQTKVRALPEGSQWWLFSDTPGYFYIIPMFCRNRVAGAVFMSVLDWGDVIGRHASSSALKPLDCFSLCLQILYCWCWWYTSLYFIWWSWGRLFFRKRRDIHWFLFIYKAPNGSLPLYLSELLHHSDGIYQIYHPLPTGSSVMFHDLGLKLRKLLSILASWLLEQYTAASHWPCLHSSGIWGSWVIMGIFLLSKTDKENVIPQNRRRDNEIWWP